MRKLADGEEFTIPSTIDDPGILDEIKEVLISHKVGKAFSWALDLMERKISVSAIQFKPPEKNPQLALERLLPLVEAASKISDLVVLPELACTN